MTRFSQQRRIALCLALAWSLRARADDAAIAAPPVDASPAPAPVEVPAAALPSTPDPIPAVEPAAPAPKGWTGIRGTVTDATDGEPIIEAAVKVTRGATKTVRTDVDGKFQLKLPPGEYDLRVYYELYEGRKIAGVVVEAGAATPLDVTLSPEAGSQQEVVVEAKADTRTEAAVLEQRKKSTAVSDAISAQEISRTPDSNAGDAAKRIVSATVQDNKVILRGLGGRYSTTLLNGIYLPSPEPDDPQPPLDMFPTALLANLNVAKTYTADLPASFAGGVLNIETNTWPTQREWKLKFGLSGDTVNTFQLRPDYQGGRFDWIGVDDGGRALPAQVSREKPVITGPRGPGDAQVFEAGRSFNQNWSVLDRAGLPNFNLGATFGDTLRLPIGKVGVLASLAYARSESTERGTTLRTLRNEVPRSSINAGTQGQTTGLLSLGWEPTPGQEVSLLSLFTHQGESRAFVNRGYDADKQQDAEETRLFWVERTLSFTQLRGDHRLPLADARLAWNGSLSLIRRVEPDTRDLVREVLDDGGRRFIQGPGSAERFFSELSDNTSGGNATITFPLPRTSIRVGGAFQRQARQFDARRFRYGEEGVSAHDDRLNFLDPSEMLAPANINRETGFTFTERTLNTDSYDALMLLGAGFASVESNPIDPLRVMAGLRYEAAAQSLTAKSPFTSSRVEAESMSRVDGSFVPAAGANFALTPRQNLRAAYAFTLSRPRFRELAPFQYVDYARGRTVSGYKELRDTRIHNADLRWEWFPGDGEVVAASGFFKQFDDPIERIVAPTGGNDLTFRNVDAARAYGVELEGRVSLARLHPALESLRAGANVAFIRSDVTIGPDDLASQTSANRPLQGQSPYIVNATLSWSPRAFGTEVTAAYNVSGPRLDAVGANYVNDIYEQPIHRLDVSVSQAIGQGFKLKGGISNLLNQDFVLLESPKSQFGEIQRYPLGVGGSLSLEWTP